jgi:S-adenosylmethionine:tRNA ribosyltransferase-isomerase
MQLSEFDFPFDASLIATHPHLPRDHARLLVLQRGDRSLAHRRVDELPDLLQSGDLLVVNNTKVMAACVAGRKRPSGAEVDILFVKDLGDAVWEILIKGTFRPGQIIEMGAEAIQLERLSVLRVRFRGLNGCDNMAGCHFLPT